MRSMKIVGGLTHGREITQSALAKWILSMLVIVEVSEAIESFGNTRSAISEQHVDLRSSRININRDNADRVKLLRSLETHNPFPQSDFLMSISSGLKGNEMINCYEAFSVGNSALTSITGKLSVTLNFKGKIEFRHFEP